MEEVLRGDRVEVGVVLGELGDAGIVEEGVDPPQRRRSGGDGATVLILRNGRTLGGDIALKTRHALTRTHDRRRKISTSRFPPLGSCWPEDFHTHI